MTEDQARSAYTEYCARGDRQPQSINPKYLKDGSWLFVEVDESGSNGRYEGVAVRNDGGVFPFYGAMGKVLRARPELGSPRSYEQFLGTTAFGRYQAFSDGVAIWEGGEDIGFPLLESLSPLRRQMCIVAFFDLRGFTSWSKNAAPDEVQQAIQAFEAAVHGGFPVESAPWKRSLTGTGNVESAPWKRLFLKGTGDGVMIVSQADWYEKGATHNSRMTELARGHGRDFLYACERTISVGRMKLAHYQFPLAIGCGIASGELHRVFLFGRFDFIGLAANEAAKLQQHAWNEICVTREFGAVLNLDGRDFDAEWELATKGWRLRSPK